MTNIVYNKDGIPFDIDAIATDLNGKLDRDCLNYSDTGYNFMSGASMPSSTYTDLTLGASASTYTGPANGYFVCLYTVNGSSNTAAFLNVLNVSKSYIGIYPPSAYWYASHYIAWTPVEKGDIVSINYQNITLQHFRFIYAEGSKSEAN